MKKIYLMAVLGMVAFSGCKDDDEVVPQSEFTFVDDYESAFRKITNAMEENIYGLDTVTLGQQYDTHIQNLDGLDGDLSTLKEAVKQRRFSNDYPEHDHNRLRNLFDNINNFEINFESFQKMIGEVSNGKKEVLLTFNEINNKRNGAPTYDASKSTAIKEKMNFLKENNYRELSIIKQRGNDNYFANYEGFVERYADVAIVNGFIKLIYNNIFSNCGDAAVLEEHEAAIAAAYESAVENVEGRANLYNNYLSSKYEGIAYNRFADYAANIEAAATFVSDFDALQADVKALYTAYIVNGNELNQEDRELILALDDRRVELRTNFDWNGSLTNLRGFNNPCRDYFEHAYYEVDNMSWNNTKRTAGKINSLREFEMHNR